MIPKNLRPTEGGLVYKTLRYLWRASRGRAPVSFEKISKPLPSVNLPQSFSQGSALAERISDDSLLLDIFAGYANFPGAKIYVHGSWADETRTPFSDLDDLLILDVSLFANPTCARRFRRWLNKVDMRFCRLDPLQHHGHWIVDSCSLNALDESYMPLNVLDGALCLQGELLVTAKVDESATRTGLLKNVNITVSNILKLYEKYERDSINFYEMKCLIGSFLLVPAYLFQINGRKISKRAAIESASEVLSPSALLAVDVCSEIRANWGVALQGVSFRIFSVVPYLFSNPHLYRRFASLMAPRFPAKRFPALDRSVVEAFIHCASLSVELNKDVD